MGAGDVPDSKSRGATTGGGSVRLRHRGRETVLPPGAYTIGRSPSCHIIIDEPLVSRQHAELRVGKDTATVRDLNSVNGVFVNGKQVTSMTVLEDGDRIGIGRQEIEIRIGGAAGTASRPPTSAPFSDRKLSSTETTKQVEALDLIGVVADKALAAGRAQQAEDILRLHLGRVLDGTRAQRPVNQETADMALDYALKLATATGNGQWVDYAVELMHARNLLCSDNLLDRLRQALEAAKSVDADLLDRYAKAIRAQSPSLEQLRSAQRLEDLARIGKTKRRP
ncbi:MAG TPA: FHA domain-containing protein [Polyangiaceae bacterium]